MTTKPIVQKITLSNYQRKALEYINKGMSVPITRIAKNRMRKNIYGNITKSNPISEVQKKVKLRELYGGFCTICQDIPAYKVSYDVENASRIERYCQKHYHDRFIKSKK